MPIISKKITAIIEKNLYSLLRYIDHANALNEGEVTNKKITNASLNKIGIFSKLKTRFLFGIRVFSSSFYFKSDIFCCTSIHKFTFNSCKLLFTFF